MIGMRAGIKLWFDKLFASQGEPPKRQADVDQLFEDSHPNAPSFVLEDKPFIDDGAIYDDNKPKSEADVIWAKASKGYKSLGSIEHE